VFVQYAWAWQRRVPVAHSSISKMDRAYIYWNDISTNPTNGRSINDILYRKRI
jgi:hypothetical protein